MLGVKFQEKPQLRKVVKPEAEAGSMDFKGIKLKKVSRGGAQPEDSAHPLEKTDSTSSMLSDGSRRGSRFDRDAPEPKSVVQLKKTVRAESNESMGSVEKSDSMSSVKSVEGLRKKSLKNDSTPDDPFKVQLKKVVKKAPEPMKKPMEKNGIDVKAEKSEFVIEKRERTQLQNYEKKEVAVDKREKTKLEKYEKKSTVKKEEEVAFIGISVLLCVICIHYSLSTMMTSLNF